MPDLSTSYKDYFYRKFPGNGGALNETDPIFSASDAASIVFPDDASLFLNGEGNFVAIPVQAQYWSRNSGSGYLYPATITDNVGININTPTRKLVIKTLNGAVNDGIALTDASGNIRTTLSIETVSTDDLLVAAFSGIRFYTGSTIGNIVTLPTNTRWSILSTGHLQPYDTNTYDIGDSTHYVRGIYATAIWAGTTSGYALWAQCTTGYGVYAWASGTGNALYGYSHTGKPLKLETDLDSSSVYEMLNLTRTTPQTPSVGIGIEMAFYIERTAGTSKVSSFRSSLTDVGETTYASKFEWWLTKDTTLALKMSLDSAGLLTANDIKSLADMEVDDTGAIYIGDKTTDGTWKIVRSGNNLIMQRRESGNYVTKQTISA